MPCEQPLTHVPYILALISIRRKNQRRSKVDVAIFQIAKPSRQREDIHLAAGIVDVELTLHVEAGCCEHIGETGAERRAAAVADMQRPGGVGGNELDLNFLALAGIAAAKICAKREDVRHHRLPGFGFEKKIDEPGAGDLRLGDVGRRRQRRDQRGGDLARVALQRLRKLQCDVASVVTVLRLFRAFDDDRHAFMRGRDRGACRSEQAGDMRAQFRKCLGRHGVSNLDHADAPCVIRVARCRVWGVGLIMAVARYCRSRPAAE